MEILFTRGGRLENSHITSSTQPYELIGGNSGLYELLLLAQTQQIYDVFNFEVG